MPSLPASPSPNGATLTLSGANRLDSVALKLADGTAFSHGGTGGTAQSLTLAADESVSSLRLCQDKYNNHTRIFYALATTSAGRTVAAGTETSDCVTFDAPSGFGLVGFAGRDGDEVDELAAIWGKV